MKSLTKPFVYFLSCAILTAGLQAPAVLMAQTVNPPAAPNAAPPQASGRAALVQGRSLLKRGNSEHALVSLEQALKLYAQANDAKGSAAARDALGDLYSRQGQYDAARNHYQEANKSFAAVNDTYNANLMLAKTGEMLTRAGHVAEARDAYSKMTVPKIDTSTMGKVKQAAKMVGKGRDLVNKGREVVASGLSAETVGKASALAADVKGTIDEERAAYRQFIIYSIYELGLGRLDYANNQLDSAKTHFNNALSAADNPFYGKFGQSRRWRVASRTSLGDIALQQGRLPDAIKLYTAASDGARKDKRADLRWPALRGIGKSKWLQAAAEKDRKKSVKLREEAIAAYRDAVTTIEAIRAGSISADESRTTFLATTTEVFDEAAGTLAERALMVATPGQPLAGAALADAAEAFKIVEQGRARSLLEMMGEAHANITEGVPADLLKRRQDNMNRQQEIAQELAELENSEEGKSKTNPALEAELAQLSTDYDSMENQIRAASPRYALLTSPQPLTLTETQQQVLDDQTALLEYSLGAKDSYLWVITQGGIGLYKLPARAVVEQQVREVRDAIIPEKLRRQIIGNDAPTPTRGLGLSAAPVSGTAGGFATASNALYKTVVEPAASMIVEKRLLIVAAGALNYVPFEALVKTGDGSAGYDALPYLITTNEIVYAPSASVIAAIRKQAAAKSTSKNVLVIGDPVFSSNDPRLKAEAKGPAKGSTKRAAKGAAKGAAKKTPAATTTAPATTITTGEETRGLGLSNALTDVAGTPAASGTGAPVKGPLLARLPGTRVEATQIAQVIKQSGGLADMWLDLNANEANVQTKDLKSYRILHLATHGLLNPKRPQFTGLVLSLVGNRSGDGFLATNEVFNLKLGAPLVMLSACETGLGQTETHGEGVIGLTRAFMYAGAPTVGVSLWSVADTSTSQLMTDFYKRLLSGQGISPSAAMRAAQQNMIAGKKYSAPFYWAPFVLIGEWR
jgi:CHAT domain-containing protein/predicted negative regulator of RcsB-dependent stress response